MKEKHYSIVLYFWIGKVKAGKWIGFRGKNFIIDDPEYDHPIETKYIYPYNPEWVGLFWNDVPELKGIDKNGL